MKLLCLLLVYFAGLLPACAPDSTGLAQPRRRTFRWLVFVLVPLAAITALVLWVSSFSEPEYKGVKLSVWLERYNNEVDAEPQRKEAAEALEQIGGKAVPTLIRWLKASDSKFKIKLEEWADKQSLVKFDFTDAYEYHNRAIRGFRLIWPQAKAAIPDLERLLCDTNTAENAAAVLCLFGPDGTPALASGLTNRDANIRVFTASAILEWNWEWKSPQYYPR